MAAGEVSDKLDGTSFDEKPQFRAATAVCLCQLGFT
jgi:hypothetical protein